MILVIDDDQAVRSSLSLLLKRTGYDVLTGEGPEDALRIAREHHPELFILDMNFSVHTSGEEGLRLLAQIKTLAPASLVILITAWGSIPLAVEGMKAGAVDFVTKPWDNERLLQSVRTALSLSQAATEGRKVALSRQELDERYCFDNITGDDEKLLEVLQTAGRVSATDASVLIMGESGTGKELIAEGIHANSHRREGPFVKVNLGGIPSSLFESEMFGHSRGAFTNALQSRIGRFETANGGTIFLDEIGDLDSNSQVKLLRVLQEHRFEVLGTSVTRTADFRVICATNRDLEDMVGKGQFREDLYYRINLITLRLPSLRERRRDIPLLVQYFVKNLKTIYRREHLSVSPEALRWLADLPWLGNVRELKNLVERTVLVTDKDMLEASDFRGQYHPSPKQPGAIDLPAVGTVTIDEMEKSMISKALEFHGKNLSKVARSLGLSRGALYRRLEKHGLSL